MKRIVPVIGLMVLLFVVPLQAQVLTDAQKADIEKSVKDLVTQYFRAWERLDLDGAIKFWSRDKLIGQMASGRAVTTLEAVLESWKGSNKTHKEHKIDDPDVRIRIISPDAVVAQFSASWKIVFTNGNVTTYNFIATELWVKESSGWKITFEAASSAAKQ